MAFFVWHIIRDPLQGKPLVTFPVCSVAGVSSLKESKPAQMLSFLCPTESSFILTIDLDWNLIKLKWFPLCEKLEGLNRSTIKEELLQMHNGKICPLPVWLRNAEHRRRCLLQLCLCKSEPVPYDLHQDDVIYSCIYANTLTYTNSQRKICNCKWSRD